MKLLFSFEGDPNKYIILKSLSNSFRGLRETGSLTAPPSQSSPSTGWGWRAPAGEDAVSSCDVVAAEVGGSAWEEEAQIPTDSPAFRGAARSRQSAVACPLPREPVGRHPPVLTSQPAPVCEGPGRRGPDGPRCCSRRLPLARADGIGLTGPFPRAGSRLPACNSLSSPLLSVICM